MQDSTDITRLNQPINSYLLDIGHFHVFAPMTAVQAKKQLALWLALFKQGQAQPLMFMPRTALAYVEAEGDHIQKLREAQPQWLDEQTQLGEGMEPHFQRLYQFPEDFSEQRFGDTAQTLLSPLISLYYKGRLGELATYVEAGAQPSPTSISEEH